MTRVNSFYLACSEWLVRCFHVVLIFDLENICDFFLKAFQYNRKESITCNDNLP